MVYSIEKCNSNDDFENGCMQPSNGEKYTAEEAINILENNYGGDMYGLDGRGYRVSYIKKQNDWIRKKLNIK